MPELYHAGRPALNFEEGKLLGVRFANRNGCGMGTPAGARFAKWWGR